MNGAIWVDADACPVVVRDILFRAARRTGVVLTLVANQPLNVPAGPNIRFLQVMKGFDIADHEIASRAGAADLVITSDIPLAAEVVAKGASVISPRGERFTRENIGARLNMRDFMDTMRASGIQSGGPPPLGPSERHAFAQALDQWLHKASRSDTS